MLIPQAFHALVIGSSGAIGAAFVDCLRQDRRCLSLTELSRTIMPTFELTRPDSFPELVQALRLQTSLNLVIDASGALAMPGARPEKALRELAVDRLRFAIEVNAVGPLLLMQSLAPFLSTKGPMLYVKLSARVGSITDNRKGGWYGYRASKAALNMMLQCVALEWQRSNPQAQVLALQPGTVRSALSKDFLQASPDALTADASVGRFWQALDQLEPKPGAQFVDYQGVAIPW